MDTRPIKPPTLSETISQRAEWYADAYLAARKKVDATTAVKDAHMAAMRAAELAFITSFPGRG